MPPCEPPRSFKHNSIGKMSQFYRPVPRHNPASLNNPARPIARWLVREHQPAETLPFRPIALAEDRNPQTVSVAVCMLVHRWSKCLESMDSASMICSSKSNARKRLLPRRKRIVRRNHHVVVRSEYDAVADCNRVNTSFASRQASGSSVDLMVH
jgi:hypothetical protein